VSALRFINWLFSPAHRLSTSDVYDLIGTASLTEHGLYLNLGYWQDADSVDEASDALAMLVATTGGMGPSDVVLDCGFGFGDQDLLWAQRCAPAKIVGLNVTASQVERATWRANEAGLGERIDFRKGSATQIPLDEDSVDLVIALESAFHFDTRERFFAEAFRVLKSGGRLVTADILPMPTSPSTVERLRQRLSWYLVASRFNIPAANVYGIDTYRAKLRASGFEVTALFSIRDQVYEPLHNYLARNTQLLDRQHPLARAFAKATLKRKPENVYAGLDYVIAAAVKPATPS
jgi:ubiquinone/menaquinone biosynthesis C-methylase UbiE